MPSAGEPRPCSVFEAEFSGYRFDFVFYAATRCTSTDCSYPCPGARDQNTRTSPKSNTRDRCSEISRTRSKSSSRTRISSSLRSRASVIQAVVPSRSFSEFFSFSCDSPTDSPRTGTCDGLDRAHFDNDVTLISSRLLRLSAAAWMIADSAVSTVGSTWAVSRVSDAR